MGGAVFHFETCGICHAAVCEHRLSPVFDVPSQGTTHIHDATCPSGCGLLNFAGFSLSFGATPIGDGETADLFDLHYGRVAIVPLPQGERPAYVLHGRRLFAYYAHTSAVGQRETVHPYREVTGLHDAGAEGGR